MPFHRDDIVAFGAQSVSVILHRHDYRIIRIGYFDRQSSRSRGGPVGIARGSGRRRVSITHRRGRRHRGGRELSAVWRRAVTPRTASCHGACNHAASLFKHSSNCSAMQYAILLQLYCNIICNVVYNYLTMMPQCYVQLLCNAWRKGPSRER